MSLLDRLETVSDVLAARSALAGVPAPVTDLGFSASLFAGRYEQEARALAAALQYLALLLDEAIVQAAL